MKWSSRALRVGRRRLHDAEESCVLIEQGLAVGIEVCGRNCTLVGPTDAGRERVGQILVRTDHGVASQIERLSWPVGQRPIGIDLRAPLAQDRSEVVYSLVIGIEHLRLR